MSKASFSGAVNGSELFFVLMLVQFGIALWLSYRAYREEPHWQTCSLLGSLLLMGLPGFFAMRILRSRCRAHVESLARANTSPEQG